MGLEGQVVAIFCRKMLGGRPWTIYGMGAETRDFVYVDDVVSAYLACREKGSGELINVSSGQELSVNDLYHQLAELTGTRFEPVYAEAGPGRCSGSWSTTPRRGRSWGGRRRPSSRKACGAQWRTSAPPVTLTRTRLVLSLTLFAVRVVERVWTRASMSQTTPGLRAILSPSLQRYVEASTTVLLGEAVNTPTDRAFRPKEEKD